MSASQSFTDFVGLVFQMREAQRNYFKHRTQTALNDSKALEKRVDNVVTEIRDRYMQTDLFKEKP